MENLTSIVSGAVGLIAGLSPTIFSWIRGRKQDDATVSKTQFETIKLAFEAQKLHSDQLLAERQAALADVDTLKKHVFEMFEFMEDVRAREQKGYEEYSVALKEKRELQHIVEIQQQRLDELGNNFVTWKKYFAGIEAETKEQFSFMNKKIEQMSVELEQARAVAERKTKEGENSAKPN